MTPPAEKISGGRLRVTPGRGKRFTLEQLCQSVEKPVLPAGLK